MKNAPRPNDVILGRTVVATCTHIDGDDGRPAEELVLFLNPQPPFFTVAHVQWEVNPPLIVASVDHYNIVPAINGDPRPVSNLAGARVSSRPARRAGYVDMGGDY